MGEKSVGLGAELPKGMITHTQIPDREDGSAVDQDCEPCEFCAGEGDDCAACNGTGKIDMRELARERRERLAELRNDL